LLTFGFVFLSMACSPTDYGPQETVADHAAVDFEDLADLDFLERLDFPVCPAWAWLLKY
jgi:hypothetical protein